MAWVTPSSVSTGDVLQAAKWNQDVVANAAELAPFFSVFTSYTPTVSQGASSNIAKTVTFSRYLQIGKMVFWQCSLSMTGSGSAGSAVRLTLPVTSASAGYTEIGFGSYYVSAGTKYPVVVSNDASATIIRMQYMGRTDDAVLGAGGGFVGAVASGHLINIQVQYEAA